MKNISHASAKGSLIYCMVCTRPDLAHAFSMISRFLANPSKECWNAGNEF